MLALIKLGATAVVTLGIALSNCGNPAGHPDRITGVNATCTGYSFTFDGFSDGDNIRLKQVVNAKVEGGDWFQAATTGDDTLLQVSGSRSHANLYNLGGGGGGKRTVNVNFKWTDSHGDANHDWITSELTC